MSLARMKLSLAVANRHSLDLGVGDINDDAANLDDARRSPPRGDRWRESRQVG